MCCRLRADERTEFRLTLSIQPHNKCVLKTLRTFIMLDVLATLLVISLIKMYMHIHMLFIENVLARALIARKIFAQTMQQFTSLRCLICEHFLALINDRFVSVRYMRINIPVKAIFVKCTEKA